MAPRPFEFISVLVVEDDVSVQAYLEKMLAIAGAGNVVICETYKQAEEAMKLVQFSGALLDLVLERGSGLDVGKLCAANGIPVVFCTATVDDHNSGKMLETGWILPKPIRLAGVVRALTYFKDMAWRCGDGVCRLRAGNHKGDE